MIFSGTKFFYTFNSFNLFVKLYYTHYTVSLIFYETVTTFSLYLLFFCEAGKAFGRLRLRDHGGRLHFSVFHGHSTLKSISPALFLFDFLQFFKKNFPTLITGTTQSRIKKNQTVNLSKKRREIWSKFNKICFELYDLSWFSQQ